MAQTSTLTTEKLKQYESRFDLGALFDFSNIVNASLDLKFILGHLLLTLMGKLLSLRGIVLIEKNDIIYTVEAVKGISNVLTGQEITLKNLPKQLIYVADEDARRLPWLKYFREHSIHVIIPLVAREKILGVVGFGQSAVKMKFNQKEETYIKSLTNIAALAIDKGIVFAELSQLNRKLDRKIQELNTLFELGKEFNTVLDSDRLIKLLLFSIMGQIGVNRYFICLQTDELMNLVSSRLDSQLNQELWRLFPSVVKPTLVSSLNKKNELAYQRLLTEAGVEVLIPLQLQNQVRGILGLGEKLRGDDYSQTDLEFLTSLGNLAIISLENARLFKEAIEKQRMEDELSIAKEIQKGLLPAKLPQIPLFDISATNISSKQVGGDYYDVISLGEEKYIIAIGDVSGKGTPASLLMANLQATIRALVPLGLPLDELTKRVNDLICDNTGSDRFITFFWGLLDAPAKTLRYVNAGHNPPFLFHMNGNIERLDKGGLILGVMKTVVPYQMGQVEFDNGEILVLFTDGVSEAMNEQGEELGEEKLEEVIRSKLAMSSTHILTEIVEEVRKHGRNMPQYDDITLVVLKATSSFE